MTLPVLSAIVIGVPTMAYLVVPRRLDMRRVGRVMVALGIALGAGAVITLTVAVFLATTRATPAVRTEPWFGTLNGQLTHCTETVDSAGDAWLNDCWR